MSAYKDRIRVEILREYPGIDSRSLEILLQFTRSKTAERAVLNHLCQLHSDHDKVRAIALEWKRGDLEAHASGSAASRGGSMCKANLKQRKVSDVACYCIFCQINHLILPNCFLPYDAFAGVLNDIIEEFGVAEGRAKVNALINDIAGGQMGSAPRVFEIFGPIAE